MNLSPSDALLLNSYLMLQRGSVLFKQEDLPETIALADITWRDINILVLPEFLADLDEGGLEIFLEKVINDRFSPWLSWVFVGQEDQLEDLELYFNLLLGSSDFIDFLSVHQDSSQDVVSSLSISYLKESIFSEILPTVSCQFHAVLVSLGLEEDSNPDELDDRFGSLPRLTLNPEKTIVESLYDDRLRQADRCLQWAVQAFQSQHWPAAVQYYQYAIQCNCFIPSLWADLGSSLFQIQQYQAAKQALEKAILMDLSNSVYYYTLGLIEEALGKVDGAIVAYQKSIDLNPDNLNSYCALGNVLTTVEAWKEAEAVYREGLEQSRWHFGLYLNLGNLYLKTDRLEEAIQTYQKVLQLAPNNPEVLSNLTIASANQPSYQYFYQGKLLESQQQEAEAILAYQRSIAIDPLQFKSVFRLCECYQNLKQVDLTRTVIQTALESLAKTHPLDSFSLRTLLLYLNKQDESELSRTLSKRYSFFQTPEIQNLLEAINFPILYHELDEIAGFRQKFEQAIDAVAQLDLSNPIIQTELFSFFRSFIHAFINYQGENDREIQSQWATIVETLLAARYPQWCVPVEPRIPTGKIRIGYASYYLRRHNGARWALGWIQHHDRQQFELYTYHFGEVLDGYTKAFCDASSVFQHLPEEDFETFDRWLETAVTTIRNDRLDLLVFPDLGMEPRTYILSKLRLAPLQCTAWGHPVTSGSKFIDYYLSSHLMESEEAQDHYTEKLVRLPHLGLCYPTPQLPEPSQDRSFFQLPNDRILYLSCQSLFKYLPQYDFIYPAIAQAVPQAYFVFLETFALGEAFSQRLQQSFSQWGLSSAEYCQILPKQSWDNYIQLQYLADIYLDTIAWTGGNSTLEAVACGLPVVTYPGLSMRSRHSYAILQRLGITETIAHSLEDYIEIAIELGQNSPWRNQLSAQYQEYVHRLFGDRKVTESLDQVFLSLVQGSFISSRLES
jgi:predicted O-linked N-acetylglucosamine transferase (SPINDLY family)